MKTEIERRWSMRSGGCDFKPWEGRGEGRGGGRGLKMTDNKILKLLV